MITRRNPEDTTPMDNFTVLILPFLDYHNFYNLFLSEPVEYMVEFILIIAALTHWYWFEFPLKPLVLLTVL